ncbi:MAG: radical SAM protein [Planctomycetaceae bacterium]|nr:MAG: radical SAM protein [Planctomycetaceae bacterium]
MNTDFKASGFWRNIKELLPGHRRMLDCVQVAVTSRCMEHCRYCPHTVFKERWQQRDMPMATFERLWPILQRAERVHLQGWGEPLLNSNFFNIAALSRKAGCTVSTTTCGMGLREKQAAALVEAELDIVAPDRHRCREQCCTHRRSI